MDHPRRKRKKRKPVEISHLYNPLDNRAPALEKHLEKATCKKLVREGWQVRKMENKWENGWPDRFAAHPRHGIRFIEFKRPGEALRPSQVSWANRWAPFGVEMHVLTGPHDTHLLRRPPNWGQFLKVFM